MRYLLTRDEVADLFRLGKIMKEEETMSKEIMHQNLLMLTWAEPHLRPNQLNWWKSQLEFYKMEVPEWITEASLEALMENYKDSE